MEGIDLSEFLNGCDWLVNIIELRVRYYEIKYQDSFNTFSLI